jgi:hypothetical protein
MKRATVVLIVASLVVCLVGCTHNQLGVDGQTLAVKQTTSPGQVATADAEGRQVAAFQGLAPSLIKQDAEGNWITMPGPLGLISYMPQTGQMFMASPQDAVLEGVEFTPNPAAGQPAFKAAKISFNISDPMKQHVAAYAAAAAALKDMTQIEATATVERMKAAGEITATVAQALLTYFVPTLK